MFQILVECGHELENILEETVSYEEIIEIKDILARCNTDIRKPFALVSSVTISRIQTLNFDNGGRKVFQSSFTSAINASLIGFFSFLVNVLKLRG
jgi:hypothetical protein